MAKQTQSIEIHGHDHGQHPAGTLNALSCPADERSKSRRNLAKRTKAVSVRARKLLSKTKPLWRRGLIARRVGPARSYAESSTRQSPKTHINLAERTRLKMKGLARRR